MRRMDNLNAPATKTDIQQLRTEFQRGLDDLKEAMRDNQTTLLKAFYNYAEVGRDVDDPAGGLTYRELVDANGAGMRFGLSWGF